MSSANDTIRTRILIISDTHTAPLTSSDSEDLQSRRSKKQEPTPPFKHPLPAADLAIHCGDLTNTGQKNEYISTLRMLSHIDAPIKLVIPGNHDLSLDKAYMLSHLDSRSSHYHDPDSHYNDPMTREAAEAIVESNESLWKTSEQAKEARVRFLDEGTHCLDLPNGARVRVHASPYTPEFCDWGFAYERRQDRFNPLKDVLGDAESIVEKPVPAYPAAAGSISSPAAGSADEGDAPIDILLTHGPPWGRLDLTVPRGDKAGCPHLLRAVTRSRPLVHCFGHIHEGWGAERIRWRDAASSPSSKSQRIAREAGANDSMTIKQFTEDGGWEREHVEKIEKVEVDLDEVKERRGKFLDLSHSGRALERGRGTLLVNAAIMDVGYRPVNGAWVLDLDLPKASG